MVMTGSRSVMRVAMNQGGMMAASASGHQYNRMGAIGFESAQLYLVSIVC